MLNGNSKDRAISKNGYIGLFPMFFSAINEQGYNPEVSVVIFKSGNRASFSGFTWTWRSNNNADH